MELSEGPRAAQPGAKSSWVVSLPMKVCFWGQEEGQENEEGRSTNKGRLAHWSRSKSSGAKGRHDLGCCVEAGTQPGPIET